MIQTRKRIVAWVRSEWPIICTLSLFVAFFVFLGTRPALRVGDGSEYYAMLLAWRDTLRPFMTPASWASYASFYDSHEVRYLVAPETLKVAYPALVSGSTTDFNHFWFYGLLPGIMGRVLAPIGHAQPHLLFLGFHCFLAAIPLMLSWKCFRWPGLLSVGVIFFLSPVLWYFDKVHTELFTVCLVLASVILFRVGHFLPSALFIALASTQNISLLAVALVVVLLDLIRRTGKTVFSVVEVIFLIATAFAVAVHPLYYFFRLGALTPQFVAGGAALGANLRTFYLWFIDPDLGLLPNWPLVVVGVLVAVAIRAIGIRSLKKRATGAGVASPVAWGIYVGIYLVINLLAQSSTQNLNSGASPGPSRYGLWYIPLFFPVILELCSFLLRPLSPAEWSRSRFDVLSNRYPPRWLPAIGLCLLAAGGSWYSYVFYRPSLPEIGAYEASWSSEYLQRHVPYLYDPPAEVFRGRYGNIGADPRLNDARAIIGPDCKKLLVQGAEKTLVFGGSGCVYSASKLMSVLRGSATANDGPFPKYVHLSDGEAAKARYSVVWNKWQNVGSSSDRSILAAGWGGIEAWGAWSSRRYATLNVPCDTRQPPTSSLRIDLALRPFLAPLHPKVDTEFFVDGKRVQQQSFELPDVTEREVSLVVPSSSCRTGLLSVDLKIVEPASPASLQLSDDPRELGVGLSRFRQRMVQ